MISNWFEYLIITVVITNSIVLSLSGNLLSKDKQSGLELTNDLFTYIFLAEFSMKIIGLGLLEYFSDITNYFDLIVVVCGLVDIELRKILEKNQIGKTLIQQERIVLNFSIVKVIRIFRVLRLLRLLRGMKTMKRVMQGIYNSLEKIMYVLILLIIFIFIYMILGMSLIKGSVTLSDHINSF